MISSNALCSPQAYNLKDPESKLLTGNIWKTCFPSDWHFLEAQMVSSRLARMFLWKALFSLLKCLGSNPWCLFWTYQDMFFSLVPERQTPADQSHYPTLFLCADLTRAERGLQTKLTVCTGSPAPVLSRDCMVSAEELSPDAVQWKLKPQPIFDLVLLWCKQIKYGGNTLRWKL